MKRFLLISILFSGILSIHSQIRVSANRDGSPQTDLVVDTNTIYEPMYMSDQKFTLNQPLGEQKMVIIPFPNVVVVESPPVKVSDQKQPLKIDGK